MIQKRKLKSNLFIIAAINEQNLTSLRCLSDFLMRKKLSLVSVDDCTAGLFQTIEQLP